MFHFSRTLQYLMLVVINKCFSIRFLAKTQSTSSRRNIAYFSFPPLFSNRPGTPPQTRLMHNSSTALSPSSTLLAPLPHPEHLFVASPSSHCLAYLPSLSQPSVVMLYRPPETPNQMLEGHTSPRLEATKRKKEEREEEEEMVLKKKGNSALEKCEKVRWYSVAMWILISAANCYSCSS